MADETIMDRARRGEFDMYEVPEDGPEVASWCPSPTPTVPPTQVHLFLPMHGAVFVIRFKSTRTLDALIAALQSHRDDVFGAGGQRRSEFRAAVPLAAPARRPLAEQQLRDLDRDSRVRRDVEGVVKTITRGGSDQALADAHAAGVCEPSTCPIDHNRVEKLDAEQHENGTCNPGSCPIGGRTIDATHTEHCAKRQHHGDGECECPARDKTLRADDVCPGPCARVLADVRGEEPTIVFRLGRWVCASCYDAGFDPPPVEAAS